MSPSPTEVNVDQATWVRVQVPIASFGIPFAREFIESYPFPTPATVYGMILSYIGEVDRSLYVGSRLAIVVTRLGMPSLVLRKIRRLKSRDLNDAKNSKPEMQTVLSGLEFLVSVSRDGSTLAHQIRQTFTRPRETNRFGGLSCGESHNLVDEFSVITGSDVEAYLGTTEAFCLQPDESGEWSVPVWVDHVGSRHTVWQRASFRPLDHLSELQTFEIQCLS